MKNSFVAYGSLMSHRSLSRTLPDKKFYPVIVKGYKRIFNMMDEDGIDSDVLNLAVSSGAKFNGLMFHINNKELKNLMNREKDYNLEKTKSFDFKTGKFVSESFIVIDYYVAIQEVISGFNLDKAYFIFDDEITDFYGWLIPKTEGVEVGVAVSPVNPKEKYKLFKKKVEERFGIKGKGEINSAIVLRPKSVKDLFLGVDSIFICGEAAGLISPSSAEGISFALLSGKYCAQALNSDSKMPLYEYKKNCKGLLERLNLKFKKSEKIRNTKKRKEFF